MKDVRTWLIIGLAAVIIFLLLFQPTPPDPDKILYEDSVKVLQSQKAAISSQVERLIETSNHKAKVSDSLLALKESEINRLKAKASKARTSRVDTLLIENPELKVFVESQDSVILVQAVLIDTLKNQLAFERGVRENLVALHYDQAKIENQMSELKDYRIISLETQLKKEKRKNRGLKVLVIIGTGLGLYGGSKL